MIFFNNMKNKATTSSNTIEHQSFDTLPLEKNNYIIMAVAGIMIVLGFILMLGGPSTPQEFNPDIFSTRRIVVGPTICFLGFVAMAIGVCVAPRKPKSKE